MTRLVSPVLLACCLFAPLALAQSGPLAPPGPAIQGYDPVAYYTLSEPRLGDPEIVYDWNGSSWRFISVEHRRLFEQDPEKYAPQYNGWCAYGAARGYAAETEPGNAWKILEGKLYLNWSPGIASRWDARRESEIRKADANWGILQAELESGKARVHRK